MPGMLVPDRSGTLLSGRFFNLEVDRDAGSRQKELSRRGGVVCATPLQDLLHTNPATGEPINYLWIQGEENSRRGKVCGQGPLEHATTRTFNTQGVRMTARFGRDVSPLIEVMYPEGGSIVATKELADSVRAQKFRGIGYYPVLLQSEEGERLDIPLTLLAPEGAYCMRPFVIEGIGENQCPLCGKGRPICTECGRPSIGCQFCDEAMWRTIDDKRYKPDDPRLYICRPEMRKEEIINGRKWDGTDFFSMGFVSKRFVTYLQSVHAAPFVAEPALVYIDGMSPEQLRWLEEVSGPLEK